MRILINSNLELTGTTPDSFVQGLSGSCDWVDQVVKPIGAVSAIHIDRGNVINTRAFRVHRTWPDAQTAETFFLTHPDLVPHIGDITFLVLDQRSVILARIKMLGAAIKVSPEAWLGCSTTMQYHFTGGVIF